MSKKYLTAKQRKKRNRTVLLCVIAGVILAAASLIAVGTALGRKADREEKLSYEYLKSAMEEDYRSSPWDGDKTGAETKNGPVWAVFEALMAVEQDGMKNGGKGIEYDLSAGNTLCFDLSAFDGETRTALERMLSDYCSKKRMVFRTGGMEQLRKEGLIDGDGAPDAYTEGCLITIDSAYDEERRCYYTEIFFYYNSRYGRSARVISVRNEDLTRYIDECGGQTGDDAFDDGLWTNYLLPGMIT